MIASPTLTSAAATTMIKKTNNCPSLPAVISLEELAKWCIFENATSNRFTAFNISSIHMNTMMALRRVSTPIMPITNKAMDRNM